MKKLTKYSNYLLGEVERFLKIEQRHVANSSHAINQWLYQLKEVPPANGRILLAAYRNQTWVEWAVYFACVARTYGFETTLLIKNEDIDIIYSKKMKDGFWEKVKCIPGINFIELSSLSFDEEEYKFFYNRNFKKCADSLAYDHRIEQADILNDIDQYGDKLERLRKYSAITASSLYKLIAQNNFHAFYCFSGLIGETFALLDAALHQKITAVCIEGWGWRKGHMIYNFNGPALEYNVKGWMKYFGEWNSEKETHMKNYFSFLNGAQNKEQWLKEFYNVQQASIDSAIPATIKTFLSDNKKVYLLACNVIADSSMLNRERFFSSQQEFVRKTVAYFKNNPGKKLIIRAHPGEEWVEAKVKIKMGTFAKQIAAGIPNILVIDYLEKINTFSLLPFTSVGLVWLSSVGVDLVVRGVPVIAVANAKYSGLGITEEPMSEDEYYNLLDRYSESEIRPSKRQVQTAMEYLYMVFKGFSFEAFGKNFQANTTKMNKMFNQKEHDTFYKIILGLVPAPDKN
ncbi:MAG: hypothetical protein ACK48W_12240 [Bacteroidota bacterium]